MTTTTLQYTGSLVVTACWCGTRLAIPKDLYDEAHRIALSVYCPLGHTFVWNNSEVDRLKRDLKYANDRRAALQANLDQTEASLRATKGHVTRLRGKVLAGACPFCGQHLRDLKRHISRQHKDETAEMSPDST